MRPSGAVLALLKDLQRETNVAMIFVSHDFGIVAKCATESR